MCCCAKPNVNGEPGYSWDGKVIGKRPPAPPALGEHDTLLFDEPGRCGGMDSHCHHYRLVKFYSSTVLLVRHGGGDERLNLSLPRGFSFEGMDSNTRYWIFNAIHHAASNAKSEAGIAASATYRKAFAEDRLKKRKVRGQDQVKVWIEPRIAS